ncbi:hypothetical protein MMC21_005366 [Puttea exsequens]|nr:hypothetical protein [Puttea exsequens]
MVLTNLPADHSHIHYTTVKSFFHQSEPKTDPSSFDPFTTSLGLISRTYDSDQDFDPRRTKTQWQRFAHYIATLNSQETTDSKQHDERYKVLFLARHGEGVHNVAEALYGTKAWDDYWSKLDGNGTLTWTDAHLTEKGIAQANKVHVFWKKEIQNQQIPTPDTYYTSPLHRCLATAEATFSGLDLPAKRPFVPTVKELFREVNGVHTCDRRSRKTYIHSQFPSYNIEPGFTETDELWDPVVRESDEDMDARLRVLLDDLFAHDKGTFVSVTSHSGAVAGVLRVLGHREFRLGTGSVVTVFVRAEMVGGSAAV